MRHMLHISFSSVGMALRIQNWDQQKEKVFAGMSAPLDEGNAIWNLFTFVLRGLAGDIRNL